MSLSHDITPTVHIKSKTKTMTKTKTKCSKDPTYVMFFKSRGFKDIKYDILKCVVRNCK